MGADGFLRRWWPRSPGEMRRTAPAGHGREGDRDADRDDERHDVVVAGPLLAPRWGGAGRGAARVVLHARRLISPNPKP